mgnify:CR=1 FL=1
MQFHALSDDASERGRAFSLVLGELPDLPELDAGARLKPQFQVMRRDAASALMQSLNLVNSAKPDGAPKPTALCSDADLEIRRVFVSVDGDVQATMRELYRTGRQPSGRQIFEATRHVTTGNVDTMTGATLASDPLAYWSSAGVPQQKQPKLISRKKNVQAPKRAASAPSERSMVADQPRVKQQRRGDEAQPVRQQQQRPRQQHQHSAGQSGKRAAADAHVDVSAALDKRRRGQEAVARSSSSTTSSTTFTKYSNDKNNSIKRKHSPRPQTGSRNN